MKILISAIAAAAALVSTSAMAQEMQPSFYGTVGGSYVEEGDIGLTALTARAGVRTLPYLGFELEGSIGVKDSSLPVVVDGEATTVDVSLKSDIAVFVVGFLPITDNVSIFGRLGTGKAKIEGEVEGYSVDTEADGTRYGVGAEFFFDDNNGGRIDFTRFDSDDLEADAYTISYIRRF